jgi:hypothetical protein
VEEALGEGRLADVVLAEQHHLQIDLWHIVH